MAKLKDGYFKNIGSAEGNDSYALLAGGGHLSYSASGGANALVQRDASGYVVNNYFNTPTGGAERNASGLGYIAGFNTGDYYIRSYTAAAVKTWLELGTNAHSSTAYLPLTGGTLTDRLTITGAAVDGHLMVRGIWGSDGSTTVGPLYLQYGANNPVVFGNAGGYSISADGSQYSGNSATATTAIQATKLYTDGSTAGSLMTFNWSGPGGQPTWLWGGNDSSNMYVYNPSNFSVNYATTSGSTSTLDYGGLQTMDTSGTLTQGTKFYGVYNNGYPTMYGNVLNIAGQGYGQLLIGWSGTTGAHADNYIRSLRDSAKETNGWSDWAKILTSANYNTYALPLSGGTLTGLLTASAGIASTTGTFSSTLGVTGATTLGSTLEVSGATTISSTLGVSGLGTFSNGIYVTSKGININDSGVWFKSSDGSTVYSNITSNNSAQASWQVIDADGTEIWFGKRGGKRILSMVTQYDTAHNISTASYTTIGFGTSIAQRNYTLQVNGNVYAKDSISTDGGIVAAGGITSSGGGLNVLGNVTAGGKVKAYGGNRGNILTLLFDGLFGYNTSTSTLINSVFVNRTGPSNPTFVRTGAGQYTLIFTSPTYISTILLCISIDETNAFYVSSKVGISDGDYVFTFKTANDNSLDDAAFRVSMLYELD